MTRDVFTVSFLSFAFCGLLGASGCRYDGPHMSLEELHARLESIDKKELMLIDVRSTSEFKKGHVPGSKNIPRKYLNYEVDNLEAVKGDLAVMGGKGSEAKVCAKLLKGVGIRAILVDGSMEQWTAAGYPVKRGRK